MSFGARAPVILKSLGTIWRAVFDIVMWVFHRGGSQFQHWRWGRMAVVPVVCIANTGIHAPWPLPNFANLNNCVQDICSMVTLRILVSLSWALDWRSRCVENREGFWSRECLWGDTGGNIFLYVPNVLNRSSESCSIAFCLFLSQGPFFILGMGSHD